MIPGYSCSIHLSLAWLYASPLDGQPEDLCRKQPLSERGSRA